MHILECIFWNACFGMHVLECISRNYYYGLKMEAASINQGLVPATLRLISWTPVPGSD